MMIRVIKTVAVLAIALFGRADAGLVIKAPRTETPGLLSGHVFVEPVPTNTPTATTVLPAMSTTSITHTPEETPCNFDTGMMHTSNPETTAAPVFDLDLDSQGQKFIQTTYWACATFDKETHCGWHQPILDTSAANTRVRGGSVALMTSFVFIVGALVLGL
ncbi:hypothetical protein F5Y12DRAFT_568059 [Xylaria sp. FL1777]|nr:hypothetical protein F5Y12DRAFT_568059 [Xylaria sp. FL1777]